MTPGTSLEAYLDHVCARLRVNPAEAEEIREELGCHLEDLIEMHAARGMGGAEATAAAISEFGDPGKLHYCLDRVYRGDGWWVLRLKGLGLGLVIGGVLGVVVPVGGHLEFAASAFPLLGQIDPLRAHVVINAMLAGGVIGLLSAGGRGLLAGWCVGSLLWLTEYVVHWVTSVAAGPAGGGLGLMSSVLLAPLLGGAFGAAVGAGSAAMLSLAGRLRPEIW